MPSTGYMQTSLFRGTKYRNVPEKHAVKKGVRTMEGDELGIPRMRGTNLERQKDWVRPWAHCPGMCIPRGTLSWGHVAEEAMP